MHVMASCHGCAGDHIDRDINLHIEDVETTDLDNDNESISGFDTTIALERPETEGHPDELISAIKPSWQQSWGEINDLCQWVEAGEENQKKVWTA